MTLKPSLGTPHSAIPTSHYYGPNHNGRAGDLYKENPGRSSQGFTWAPSFVFHNKSTAPTWNTLMEHSIHAIQLDGYYVINSSNSYIAVPISDWKKYGANPMVNRDDLAYNLEGWIKATEESQAIEYVESPAFKLFVTERHEHLADPTLGKYITDTGYIGPLGDLGKHLSQAETLRQDWKRYLASKEGQELASQKGNINGIEYLGVWPVEGVIYGVGRTHDGKLILVRGEKSYKILAAEADFAGVSLEDRLKAALGEEAMHIARQSFDKGKNIGALIDEELATKADLLKFYEALAKSAESKPELKAVYGKLARLIRQDLATAEERYRDFAEQHLGSNSLIQNLIKEAYALGLETEREISAYVAAKLESNAKSDADARNNSTKKITSLGNGQEPDGGNENSDNGDNGGAIGNDACGEAYSVNIASAESGESAPPSE